jgi:haloalkane dehalogenase
MMAPNVDDVYERDLRLKSGERMHYRTSGPADGPPILMLHGNPAYSYAWTEVMKRLASVGRCIAPDLMGFGDSDKPRISYTFYNHAEYLDEFVEGLNLRNLTLFIQDWGGALGFDHAVRHQDNICGIAFFEVILKPYDSWETFPIKLDPEKLRREEQINRENPRVIGPQLKSALARQKFQDFRQGDIGSPGWYEITEMNEFLKVFMGPLLGHPFDPREIPEPEKHPELGPLLAPYLRPFPTGWSRYPIWRLPKEIPIRGEAPSDLIDTIDHYSHVLMKWDVPKLLIYSDHGPTLKEEHAQWVRQNWGGPKLTVRNLDAEPGANVVEGTHFLQQTHPGSVAKFFEEWYATIPHDRARHVTTSYAWD